MRWGHSGHIVTDNHPKTVGESNTYPALRRIARSAFRPCDGIALVIEVDVGNLHNTPATVHDCREPIGRTVYGVILIGPACRTARCAKRLVS